MTTPCTLPDHHEEKCNGTPRGFSCVPLRESSRNDTVAKILKDAWPPAPAASDYYLRGNAVPNSVVLMFIRGWQGGTDTQIAQELGVTREDIHNANYERMGVLMRLAQTKRYDEILSKIDNATDRT